MDPQGCVVTFLSNFLALLIKLDAAESKRDALGGLLIAINVFLVVAVAYTAWFATQQAVDDARDNYNVLDMAKTMVTAAELVANSLRVVRKGKSSFPSDSRFTRSSSDPAIL